MNFETAFNLLVEKVTDWFEAAVIMMPNLFIAVVVAAIFYLLSKPAYQAILRVLSRVSSNQTATEIVAGTMRFVIIVTGFFIALGILNLDRAVTSLLAGAGVIGLALGFAFQEIASNFIAGLFIAFRRPFRVGDLVNVDVHTGTITEINLRTTKITTFQGLDVLVPNKDMFTLAVTNYTSTQVRRVDLPVGVSYGEDLERVRDVVLAALEPIEKRIGGKKIELFFKEFGDSSINFEVRVWISEATELSYLHCLSDMVIRIKKAFDENSIVIPFPIRTLDFGIKGGEKFIDQAQEITAPFLQTKESSH